MSFVKPELHHRRSFSRKSEKRRKRKTSSTDVLDNALLPDTSSPSSILQALPAGTSDSALPSLSESPTRSPLSRRRSKPEDENNEDTPNKRRKKDPEFWWEITRDTTVLKPLPSSSGEVSKSKGWATTNSSSSDEDIGEDFFPMEDIRMDSVFVSDVEKQEIHDGISAAVSEEHILPIQGDALKELFDASYDQRQLYNDWQGDVINTPEEDEGVEVDKNKVDEAEETQEKAKEEKSTEEKPEEPLEGQNDDTIQVGEDGQEKEEQDQNRQPTKPATKSLSIPKLKDALVTLRAGVGKFSLRIKEAQDKKIVPDTEIKPKRSSTYRAMLMHRDSNHCLITHARDSLIAAHILPFTIASLARSHRFWSLLRLMLGPTICDQLFERYGYKTTRHHQGNKGINSPENGWILRYDLDGAFSRMECYLEPILDEPNKYIFKWLQEPKERIRMSVYHSNENRQDELLKSGEIIDLTPAETPEAQNIPNQGTTRVVPPPSRALLQMQAAIHKLAHKFQGQADIFNTRSHPDWDSDSVSSIEEEYELHERSRQYELAQPLNADNHMYFCDNKVVEWLRSVSPEQPEKAGMKRKRSDFEEEVEEAETQPQTETTLEADNRPTKRTKTSHFTFPKPVSQPIRKPKKSTNMRNIKVPAAKATPETGLLSPGITNKSETSPEEKGRTRRYIARECKRALTYESNTATPSEGTQHATKQVSPATPVSRKRGHASTAKVAVGTSTMQESGKARVSSGGVGSRKRKRT
ncbi:hypothetical protein TWF569_010225 [Orbilia oligospora]|uniref:HNH nuclease domain-containing protein n=1 Tax=Orbilia oligospora TaxID=2813651 RepID=A0A7C8NIW6_ORBOL|nr:hypothetical protein TWF706_004296 [Orbilia oligospora]KAF3112792.1 hypothetical protein TWF102_004188 [Orbilia oligospora]KAF3117718.1 hypothetical protein TWF103_004399 [Orbilia oligospora]KAF3134346.1 hypothetical protein TWF569_010225 [Orbilia oligospora]KAF3151990.1 hypothetical protein TWF594_005746 [Orbilia oligospora]